MRFGSVLIVACLLGGAAPSYGATVITSVAADGSNHLGVAGASNLTFTIAAPGQPAGPGTAAQAAAIGLTATIVGNASRTIVSPWGNTPYNVYAVAPAPDDGNGYFAIGGTANNGFGTPDTDGQVSSLTLLGTSAYSSISLFIGSLDAYNTVQLLDAAGGAVFTATGTAMAGGAAIPFPGNTSAADNRRVTFTGTGGTVYYGAKFYNTGNNSAFEFDNVSFTAAAAIPEPASWAMMVIGFGAIGGAMRRRRDKPGLA